MSCLLCGYGVQLRIVVQGEFYIRAVHRFSCFVFHFNLKQCRGGIVACDVNLRVLGRAPHHFLRTIVFAEDARVHEHAPGSRRIEPAKVQHGFRLAGSEEVPFAVNPHLHPRVVVVGMSPAGCVDLACGNAHSPHGGYGQRALLAAAPSRRTDRCQGRRRACVAGGISNVLVAPVVHLQRRVSHRQMLHPRCQLPVKDHA